MQYLRPIATIKLLVAILCLSFSNSYAGDSERISRLEKEVEELQGKIKSIEKILTQKSTQNSIATSEGWKNISNWRSLKNGMSYEEVRAILGEPQRIDGGEVAFWRYPNQGRITFMQDKLYSWVEPR